MHKLRFIALCSLIFWALTGSNHAEDFDLSFDGNKKILFEKVSWSYIKDETEREKSLLRLLFSELEEHQNDSEGIQRILKKWKLLLGLNRDDSVNQPYSKEIEPLLGGGGELYYYNIHFMNYYEYGVCVIKEGKIVYKHCEAKGMFSAD